MKYGKRLLAILLVLVFALLTVPFALAETVDSGSCGDSVTWTLDSDGTLTISGSGEMENYDDGESPWHESSDIKSVIIEPRVMSIGNYAFSYCHALTSITIPNSVTSIGESAFQGCDALTDVYYEGNEAQWDQIDMDSGNDNISSASIHCASTMTQDPLPAGEGLTPPALPERGDSTDASPAAEKKADKTANIGFIIILCVIGAAVVVLAIGVAVLVRRGKKAKDAAKNISQQVPQNRPQQEMRQNNAAQPAQQPVQPPVQNRPAPRPVPPQQPQGQAPYRPAPQVARPPRPVRPPVQNHPQQQNNQPQNGQQPPYPYN